MNEKDKKFFEKWNRIRSKGLVRYLAFRALPAGFVLSMIRTIITLLQIVVSTDNMDQAKEMLATYILVGLWLDLLVSFVLFTLIACWAVWTIWKVKENRFNELLAMTNNQEIPRDYSVPSPRGVKEKFPDFDWERKGK